MAFLGAIRAGAVVARAVTVLALAVTVVACSAPAPPGTPAPSPTPAPAADTRVSPMGGQTVPRSDPAAQFIVAGQTVDATGTPEGGLEVFLVALPAQDTMLIGNVRQETAVVWTPTDAEGSFELRCR